MPQPSTPPEPPQLTQAQGQWLSADDIPIVLCNQVAFQGVQDAVIMTVGQASPPLLSGTPEEQQAAIASMNVIPIRPIARYVIPQSTLAQLAQNMQALTDRLRELTSSAQTVAGEGASPSQASGSVTE